MGMSGSDYWDGDATLVKAYKKAAELKLEQENSKLWLQGAYIYEAFGRIAPLLHPFPGGDVKAQPYLEQPYALTEQAAKKQQEEKERREFENMMRTMRKFADEHNERFKRR